MTAVWECLSLAVAFSLGWVARSVVGPMLHDPEEVE